VRRRARRAPGEEEHAFIEAFFRNVDWPLVERRLSAKASVRPAAA